jgi:hypothetical protein
LCSPFRITADKKEILRGKHVYLFIYLFIFHATVNYWSQARNNISFHRSSDYEDGEEYIEEDLEVGDEAEEEENEIEEDGPESAEEGTDVDNEEVVG